MGEERQEDVWRRRAEELKVAITSGRSLGDLRKGFKPDPTQGKTIRDYIKSQPKKK